MKNITLLLLLVSLIGTSQVAHDPTIWNSIIGTEDVSIFNPEEEELIATVAIDYNDKEYTKDITIQGKDWVKISYKELGFTFESMPITSGTAEMVVRVAAGGQGVLGDFYFLSSKNRNQPYEIDIKEIEERINIYGAVIDDCVFWIDLNGYNYVIRSHNKERVGIYVSHWIMNVNGDTERINYYKGVEPCDKQQIQRQGIGYKPEDANEDGYMEFYCMLVDACASSQDVPLDAFLIVFTNMEHLTLVGRTYGVGDGDDIGGDYVPTAGLINVPKILESAETAWEVYVME